MIDVSDILDIMKKNDIKVETKQLNCEEPLKDQGLDSLDLIIILFSLEELYHLKISEEEIDEGKLDTINAIVDFVNTKKKNEID